MKKNRSKKKSPPKVFVISGPGGAGKTTLVDKLFYKKTLRNNFIKGISFTTRKKRPQEKEGRDYFFISKEEFLRLKKRRFFLENQKVLENYYGTPRFFYDQAKKENKDLVLCIDVKGGMYLKKNFKLGKIVAIFISAPSEAELYSRLKKRVERKGLIKKRLKLAKKELQFCKYYDYLIVNQKIKASLKDLENVLLTQKLRR